MRPAEGDLMTTLTAMNPTTGTVAREVPAATEEQITAILNRARTAYESWKDTSFAQRAEVLRAVAAHMRENVEELAPLMTEEMGKPITEARGEVAKAAWAAEHRSEEHTSELQSRGHLVCRLLLEK